MFEKKELEAFIKNIKQEPLEEILDKYSSISDKKKFDDQVIVYNRLLKLKENPPKPEEIKTEIK